MTSITECHDRSLALLMEAAGPLGFSAATGFDHYRALWSRDALITCLGAHASEDPDLIAAARRTLDSLIETQSAQGQIAAVVRDNPRNWDWAEGGAVDASAWFVIVAADHVRSGHGSAADLWPPARRALQWLRNQDVTGTLLLSSAPATDWMDSSLVRNGIVGSINMLWAWAAAAGAELAAAVGEEAIVDPARVARHVNVLLWPRAGDELVELWDHVDYPERPSRFGHVALGERWRQALFPGRRHYISHVAHADLVDRCDVLANLLAVLSGVADVVRASTILDFLSDHDVADPYPTRVWPEPVVAPGPMLLDESAIPPRWRNPPGAYHNGAVWPYVGALHAAAAAHLGLVDVATQLLQKVAAANALGNWSFPEWIDHKGSPHGAPGQVWNAGAYVYAHARTAAARRRTG